MIKLIKEKITKLYIYIYISIQEGRLFANNKSISLKRKEGVLLNNSCSLLGGAYV